jgi:very-short-patch-repair endonuclease
MTPPPIPEGLFTWPVARAAGLSRHRLDQLLLNGDIRKVLRNVYVRADVPDTVDLRVRAAALVLSPFVVVRDRTAAWLWGVDTFEFRELEIPPPLEASAFRDRARPRGAGVTGGIRDLVPHDVVELCGMPVTTPLRTALDLACKLSRRDALAALDGFMRLHGITHAQLRRELVRYFRRRGVVQARELIQYADPRAESPGESWTRMAMIDRGLRPPELQHWVTIDGVPTYRLDMAYPKHRVAIEFDGREFHEGEERRAADRARRRWLEEHGWTVIVVTKDDFTEERIDEWVHAIRVALRLAA